jgi:hypothetical protein
MLRDPEKGNLATITMSKLMLTVGTVSSQRQCARKTTTRYGYTDNVGDRSRQGRDRHRFA